MFGLAVNSFSLQQCQEVYAHMDMDLKKHLRHKMDSIGPEYGLVELSYPSFVRAFGFRSQPLCAADVVEGVGALLEAAGGLRLEVEIEGGRGGGEWFGGGRIWNFARANGVDKGHGKENRDNSRDHADDLEAKKNGEGDEGGEGNPDADKWWVNNFWIAFDALGKECVVTLSHSELNH